MYYDHVIILLWIFWKENSLSLILPGWITPKSWESVVVSQLSKCGSYRSLWLTTDWPGYHWKWFYTRPWSPLSEIDEPEDQIKRHEWEDVAGQGSLAVDVPSSPRWFGTISSNLSNKWWFLSRLIERLISEIPPKDQLVWNEVTACDQVILQPGNTGLVLTDLYSHIKWI